MDRERPILQNVMNTPMTTEERILALDAALVACEGVTGLPINSDLHKAVNEMIAPTLERHQPFGKFLDAQRAAVKRLYDCPETFGAKP